MISTVSLAGMPIGVSSGSITGAGIVAVCASASASGASGASGTTGAGASGRRAPVAGGSGAGVGGVAPAASPTTVVGDGATTSVTTLPGQRGRRRYRGGDVTDPSGTCGLPKRWRRGRRHHRDAGDETHDREYQLAAQHLRVQRLRFERRAPEEVDDARLDVVGVLAERVRQCDEVVGAQRDRLAGRRLA